MSDRMNALPPIKRHNPSFSFSRINAMAFSSIPSLPFGGVGESGFGRIHGDDGLREFARPKATAEQRFALPVNPMSFEQPTNAYDQMKGM